MRMWTWMRFENRNLNRESESLIVLTHMNHWKRNMSNENEHTKSGMPSISPRNIPLSLQEVTKRKRLNPSSFVNRHNTGRNYHHASLNNYNDQQQKTTLHFLQEKLLVRRFSSYPLIGTANQSISFVIF